MTGGEAIGQIFLAGAGDLKIWVEYLEQAFNYAIRFDVANLSTAKNLPPEMLHAVLVAFGLALRSMGYRYAMGDIQLLPKMERRSNLPQLLTFLGLECLLVLMLFAAVRYGVFLPYRMHLEGQNKAVLGPADQEFPTLASRSTGDLIKEKESMGERVGQLKKFFSGKVSAASLVRSLGQGLPQSVLLDLISLEEVVGQETSDDKKGGRRLLVSGICYLGGAENETATISAWVKALGERKIMARSFTEVKLDEIKREKFHYRNVTRFRILGE